MSAKRGEKKTHGYWMESEEPWLLIPFKSLLSPTGLLEKLD